MNISEHCPQTWLVMGIYDDICRLCMLKKATCRWFFWDIVGYVWVDPFCDLTGRLRADDGVGNQPPTWPAFRSVNYCNSTIFKMDQEISIEFYSFFTHWLESRCCADWWSWLNWWQLGYVSRIFTLMWVKQFHKQSPSHHHALLFQPH